MSDVQLFNGDCLSILDALPDGCVEAVITDPPYGIGGDVVRGGGGKVESLPKWDVFDPSWLAAADRICAPDATLVTFCDPKTIGALWSEIERGGFRPRQVVYWVKHAPPPNPRRGFQSSVETAIVARRGNAAWNGAGLTPNVWYEGPHKGRRSHPCEKPIGVMRWLVDLLSHPGATVCDPFMGSATTGVACIRTGRKFIGIECDPAYFKIAQDRIANAQRARAEQLIPT